MINSMTAYARSEHKTEDITVVTEIRSYNSKNLDISLRTPQAFSVLEAKIKSLISEKIARGRIEIRLSVEETSEASNAFEIDEKRAGAYKNALVTLKDLFDLDGDISLDLLSNVGGIIKPVEVEKDIELQWLAIEESIKKALDELGVMRKNEGSFLAEDLVMRLEYIERNINIIEKESANLLPVYQERLKDRILSLTKGIVDIDIERIAIEAAFLADKSDISEEIVRARSHVKQFREIMESGEPAGRKLNFLIQEFNREFNTVGSKTGKADVSHIIVSVKSELEKIREQVQNIE
jgi:uncharacterized protein (TIGR00255 family)